MFDLSTVDQVLDLGETLTASFQVDVSSLEPNEYWVSAYVLSNLNIYQGLRKWSLEPTTDTFVTTWWN